MITNSATFLFKMLQKISFRKYPKGKVDCNINRWEREE